MSGPAHDQHARLAICSADRWTSPIAGSVCLATIQRQSGTQASADIGTLPGLSSSGSTTRARSAGAPRPLKHAFGFLDETGTIHGPRDPFFAVGLLRCREPYELLRPLQRMRDREKFYDEIKWNKVSNKKLPILKTALDVFFGCKDASFSAFIVDKAKHDVIARYGGQFEAYDALARQLVHGSVRRSEVMWVIADEYSTPPKVTFEENVRDHVNARLRRQAVAGVCRMRSSGVDLLQIADLLLGTVVYEHKNRRKLGGFKPKLEMLRYVKSKSGAKTFIGGYSDGKLNVREYGS